MRRCTGLLHKGKIEHLARRLLRCAMLAELAAWTPRRWPNGSTRACENAVRFAAGDHWRACHAPNELSHRSTHGVVAGVSRVTDLDLPRCRGRGLGLAATPVPGVCCVSSASMSATVALLRSRCMTCPQCGQTCMRSESSLGTSSQQAEQRCDGLSWRVLLRCSRVPASSALYASI